MKTYDDPDEPDVPLAALVDVSARVAVTSKRSDKVALLAGFLAGLPTARVRTATSVLSGTLPTPPLGVGPARLRAAWVEATAQTSLEEPGPPLTLGDLERGLEQVAAAGGAGSVARKIGLLRALLDRATPEEQAFVHRLCFGELRQGALDGVMLEAVAAAFDVPQERVRRAHMLTGDLPHTALVAAAEGADGLSRIGLRVLRPLEPMLASTATTLTEAIARHGTTLLEWKLDGARIQVHRAGREVMVFTRNLREVGANLPDVVAPVAALPAESVVLDGEAIALRADGRPHAFQTTMGRFGSSRDDPTLAETVPLTPFFFDVLHADGETLVDRPLRERVAILRSLIAETNLLPSIETDSAAEAEAFLRDARRAGHEGVMAKDPESTYGAGRRGKAWLKIKPARTLDLVVLAVERGSGRRAGSWSNIHLGARDEETGDFVMLGKTFKGMTDETLRWQTETFPPLATRVEGHVMYLRPAVVAEIAFNEIQVSRRYPAGMALRFARLKRYRPDKTPEEADTIETLRRLFAEQAG
jgi:DNA ligase-1